MKPVSIHVERREKFQYVGRNRRGNEVNIDIPAKIGGDGTGPTPMELVLMGLAGCASFDLTTILEKQRQTIDFLAIDLEGVRGDEVPAVYRKVHLTFTLKGEIEEDKLKKALELSVEKYCSVCSMVNKTAEITYDYKLNEE